MMNSFTHRSGRPIMHRPLIEQVQSPDDFLELQRHHRWHEMDRNAKRFAAAVLMPAKQIDQAADGCYAKLVKVAGFGDVQAVKKHLAGSWPSNSKCPCRRWVFV